MTTPTTSLKDALVEQSLMSEIDSDIEVIEVRKTKPSYAPSRTLRPRRKGTSTSTNVAKKEEVEDDIKEEVTQVVTNSSQGDALVVEGNTESGENPLVQDLGSEIVKDDRNEMPEVTLSNVKKDSSSCEVISESGKPLKQRGRGRKKAIKKEVQVKEEHKATPRSRKKPEKKNVKEELKQADHSEPQVESEEEISWRLEDKHLVPPELAKLSWPHRFQKNVVLENEEGLKLQYISHYTAATVEGVFFQIGQCIKVQADPGKEPWLGRVVEIFKCKSGEGFYRIQWFFRSYDTILESLGSQKVDPKKIWWSQLMNTNEITTVIGTVKIVRIPHPPSFLEVPKESIPECDFYYYQGYKFENMSFFDIPSDDLYAPFPEEEASRIGLLPHKYNNFHGSNYALRKFEKEAENKGTEVDRLFLETLATTEELHVKLPKQEQQLTLLDLYSGCGAMSTGLEMGGPLAGVTIETKWAVDFNAAACVSLKDNHPNTEVRHEKAEDFLSVCQAWKKLCEDSELSFPSKGGAKKGAGKAHKHKRAARNDEEKISTFDDVAHEEEAMAAEEEDDFDGEVIELTKEDTKKLKSTERKRKGDKPKAGEKEKKNQRKSSRGDKGKKGKLEKEEEDEEEMEKGEFEVAKLVGIRWVSTNTYVGLQFKVRWKGYTEEDDTWEPEDALGECGEAMRAFVAQGKANKILPLPGDVGIICGGPPCQGASGHNRFRNYKNPLEDEKNRQLIVFMDIVHFLQPRFVLMENVVDLMKLKDGLLAKYAVCRLVQMNYQSRTGIVVAGSFGVAQFRMRAFFFGAKHGEELPQFPLPTHLCAFMRNNVPVKWVRSLIGWDENTPELHQKLQTGLVLGNCIDDLPSVPNKPGKDEMEYLRGPNTLFERRMRLPKSTFIPYAKESNNHDPILHDHRPLELNEDDYYRTTFIPKKKGACFRDLPGVKTLPDKTCIIDPAVQPRPTVPCGKPLCPDYAISFRFGKSFKPFARLWWDETVPTVVTRAEPHNQQILHPTQDRVLTIRENARLQGFPDHYKLFGHIKERYCQVGNAVSVPAAQALGFMIGQAALGKSQPGKSYVELPLGFPFHSMRVEK